MKRLSLVHLLPTKWRANYRLVNDESLQNIAFYHRPSLECFLGSSGVRSSFESPLVYQKEDHYRLNRFELNKDDSAIFGRKCFLSEDKMLAK